MPLICIGPVCVPISALLPILAYLARPVWRRLPPPTQQAILAYWKAFAEWTQANVPVVVDFTATWCGPCQRIKPFFEELAAAHKGALFVKVDVDELESVSQAAEVLAMPTFQVYREGRRVDTLASRRGGVEATLESLSSRPSPMIGARMEALKAMVESAVGA
ncbi:thioredoxin [Emiliania huxleyi CCMP1516]|uniref:Thioredoxin domain-containing protein n=2 Tax=Emiliania huxleyi TaxID=2903 RepID=A0A0D3IEB1_EMIH1|nr:thioredoxin [Emiliania huxleyi CCMP1516]EOD09596.1 thioredoxin [Emiliania huxleyi CCMP1516]|eukprot:XP_005762025.1 thioredoxin [Emiliania huxleyi CCMP1516]